MNAQQAAALCRFARAACPQQAIDELTPDAWHALLDDIEFEDAKAALLKVTRERPFCSPAEIRAQVRAIRNQRILGFGPLPDPPTDLPDSEYVAWRRDLIRRIANGEPVERPAIVAPSADHEARRDEILRGAFRDVSDDGPIPDPGPKAARAALRKEPA